MKWFSICFIIGIATFAGRWDIAVGYVVVMILGELAIKRYRKRRVK